ncbi:hypothetical protein D7V82_02410 [bacterium 1xD8-6]|nr:hypothetical protein D7V72_01255 [bacterium D16-36]RKI72777.1 hypothetical protein D7V82_02410 [bacterium 1xD8-6]
MMYIRYIREIIPHSGIKCKTKFLILPCFCFFFQFIVDFFWKKTYTYIQNAHLIWDILEFVFYVP